MSTSLVNKERFIPSRLSNLAMWLDAQETSTITVSATTGGVTSWADRSSNGNTMDTSTFSIPGCALWLDAADTSTIVGSSPVTQWNDKSGNGRNATASGTTLTVSTLNGVPAINYPNPGTSWLTAPVTSGVADPFTIFVVFNATYPINGPLYTTSTTNDGTGFFFDLTATSDSDTNRNDFLGRGNPTNNFFIQSSSTFRGNTSYVISIVSTSVNGGTITLFRNGTSYMSTTTLGNFVWTTLLIGKRNITGSTDNFSGKIGEFIVFNSAFSASQRQQVERYLLEKWSILVPLSIPGCALWLDAADSTTITGTTTSVSEWRDKSGNGYNAVPHLGTISQTTLNGLNALNFGTTGVMKANNFLWPSSFTQFFVGFVTGTQGIIIDTQTSGGSAYGMYVYTGNGNLLFVNNTANTGILQVNDSVKANGTPVPPTNQWFIFSIGYGSTGTAAINYTLNGTVRTTTVFAGAGGSATHPALTLYINGTANGTLAPGGARIAELIHFNSVLTTSQRQRVEAYLSQKWNIPLSYSIPLPSSVPVFSLPPIISNTTTNQPSVFFPKGSQMISTLTSGRLVPPTIPGCVLWLDAADASTIAFQSGTNMSQWTDKSGNGNHGIGRGGNGTGTIVSTTGGPNYVSSTNGITFNGTQFFIASSLKISTQNHCLIAVHNPTITNGNATGNTRVFSFQGQGGSAFVVFPYMLGTTPRGYISSAPGAQTYTASTLLENSVAGQKNLIVANIAATSQLIFKNGGIQNSATSSITALESSGLSIGRFYASDTNTAGEAYQGTIHELIVFSTSLTTSQRQQVEGYLATKWGLRDNLPPSHPYYSVPYTNPISKSFVAVYQCPTVASAMNIGIGSNTNSSAFGLCQSNSVLYSPYQYVVGDISFGVVNYTGMNYTFASFDVSTNILSGIPGFNDLSTAAVAFQNKAFNTPFYIGSSTTLYTSSGFHLCEFIATSNALSATDRQSVEGYLASKWGLLDQLPFSHPYKNFQPSGDEWIPPTLPTTILGLVSWLDMTYPGQTTASIADRVGGSFTVNVGSGNQFQLSNINNLPTLYFPGNSSNYLYKTSLPSTAEGSVLFVFNITDTRSDLPILTWRASTGTAPWGPLLTYTAGTTLKLQNNYAGATGADTTPLTLAMTSGTNLVFFAWDYSNFYLSVNGGIPVIGSNAIPGSATTMYIGANTTTGTTPIMNFGELVVYNQYFEKSERQLLEGYLAWKWSVVTKLPGSHPFSKQSPTGATVVDTDALNTPAQIASLTTWLDAADSATIVQSLGKVTQWYDKSATSDVFLGTTTTAPTYSTTNGPYLPGVYFSGQNALRGTVSAAIASGVGTCFMLATISGNNGQVFTGDYVSTTTPAVGKSFGLTCVDKNVTSPLQSDARVNRNPLPGVLSTTTSILYSQMNAAITSKIGVGSYGFTTPTNVVSIVNNQSVSWQPSVPSTSPWNLGYLSTYNAQQDFYLHEFLCFSEYFTETQRFVVEGYLAWKWRIQSQLPVGHPYKNVRPVDAPFSPNLVAGIALWLDAADSSTITGTTSVTNVADKSGSNVILSSATGFSWPNNRFNGRYPSFYNPISTQGGTGANYTLGINSSFSKTTPFTVFFVGQYTSDVVPGYIMDSTSADGRPYTYQANISTPFGSLGTAKVLTSPSVVSMNWIAGTSQVYVNGELKYGGSLTAFTTSGITVGNRYSLTESFPGHICEFIWFSGTLSGYQRQQIEGYLAWKWGLQSSLPPTHLFKNAIPTRSTNFTPASVPGIALWLDAADASTIVGTTTVNEWKDKSGNGLNATKNNDVAPTYSSTGFNGLPGVLFNGSTTRLHTPSISPRPVLSSNGTDTTIFVVLNWIGGVNGIALGLDTTGNTFAFYVPWTYPSTTNGNIFADLGNDTLGRFGYFTVFAPASAPYVFSVTRSGLNGSIYVNGNIHASSTTLGGTIGTTSQTLGIGSSVANDRVFNSYIGEILIYNRALTTSEREKVEGYLAWKWRRQSTLGTTHPYSKFAP